MHHDPPSAEQKKTDFWERTNGFRRHVVNRSTLMMAIRLLALLVRILDLVRRLFGDF
jgi:hypothetical protein